MSVTLTVDKEFSQDSKKITINGGLNFATNVNTALRVETLESGHHGSLEIGNETTPIDPNVTARIIFADHGDINRTEDPKQLSKGAVLMGPVTIWGGKQNCLDDAD